MIAMNNGNGCPQEPQPDKGQALIATATDLKLAGRAIRERWPVSRSKRKKILSELYKLVVSTEQDPQVRISAAGKLLDADKVNIAAERNRILKKKSTVHNHLHLAGNGASSTQPIEDAEYIAFAAARTTPNHKQPGILGPVGD